MEAYVTRTFTGFRTWPSAVPRARRVHQSPKWSLHGDLPINNDGL